MKQKPNYLLIAICSLIVLAGGYWFFFTGSGNDVPLAAVSQASPAQARFQTLVGQLNGITFDTRVLSDPRFMALVDLTTAIAPETAGRIDPFSPVPGVSSEGGGASAGSGLPR